MTRSPNKVVIPYKPRKHQLEIHKKLKRFNVIICMRRFGKTVLLVNQLIKTALTCPLPRPHCFFITGTFSQAKKISWEYFIHYTSVIPNIEVNHSELKILFPNGATIQLLSAERGNNIRGIYADEICVDEMQDIPISFFYEILRPCIADRDGRIIFSGTSKGMANSLYELYQMGKSDPDKWFTGIFKASECKVLPESELEEIKKMLPPQVYQAEMECSFEANAIGSIYAEQFEKIDEEKRITKVPYDPIYPTSVFFDLGMSDLCTLWFVQIVGTAYHFIDYYENSGQSIGFYHQIIQDKDYNVSRVYFPFDGQTRELGTGKSRYEIALSLGMPVELLPRLKIIDGINTVRMQLDKCWFDEDKTRKGISALRQYRWAIDNKGLSTERPEHNMYSHASDCMRYALTGLNSNKSWAKKLDYPNLSIV